MVDRALALGDAEGLEAVTIRRMRHELGVTPMALYWHFRNKEELLAGLADQIWAELDTDVDPSAAWPTRCAVCWSPWCRCCARTRAPRS